MTQQQEEHPSFRKAAASGYHTGRHVVNQAAPYAKTAQGCMIPMLHLLTYPPEVFLRHRFGIRYVTFGKLAWSLFAIHLLIIPIGLMMALYFAVQSLAEETEVSPLAAAMVVSVVIFDIAFIVMAICQYGLSKAAQRRGEERHTLSDGEPWPRLLELVSGTPGEREYKVRQYIEPAIVGGIGLVGCLAGLVLGQYLFVTAILMLIKTSMMYSKGVSEQLDHQDHQIDVQRQNQSLSGSVGAEPVFLVEDTPLWPTLSPGTVESMTSRLHPSLRKLISDTTQ